MSLFGGKKGAAYLASKKIPKAVKEAIQSGAIEPTSNSVKAAIANLNAGLPLSTIMPPPLFSNVTMPTMPADVGIPPNEGPAITLDPNAPFLNGGTATPTTPTAPTSSAADASALAQAMKEAIVSAKTASMFPDQLAVTNDPGSTTPLLLAGGGLLLLFLFTR